MSLMAAFRSDRITAACFYLLVFRRCRRHTIAIFYNLASPITAEVSVRKMYVWGKRGNVWISWLPLLLWAGGFHLFRRILRIFIQWKMQTTSALFIFRWRISKSKYYTIRHNTMKCTANDNFSRPDDEQCPIPIPPTSTDLQTFAWNSSLQKLAETSDCLFTF